MTPEETRLQLIGDISVSGVNVMSRDDFLKEAETPDVLYGRTYLFVGTGGTESLVSEFVKQSGLKPPIVLLSHPGNNSLPAAMETRAYFQQIGMNSRIIHAPLESLRRMIQDWERFSRAEEEIRKSRLGVVGKPSFWLIASQIDEKAVKKRWGTSIESFSIDMIERDLNLDAPQESRPSEFIDAAKSNLISDEELAKAGAVAKSLSEFVAKNGLNAVTVECFTLLEDTNISGCHALSQLNDKEGLVAGCEGDIPAAFTMMVAKVLTNQASFLANVAHVDPSTNSAILAHCTIATSLTEEYDIMTHFETGKSVAIRGKLSPQRVTVLKIFGSDLSEYWISGGTITENLENDSACRTQIRVKMDESVDYFLESSLANHHIVVPGDHVKTFHEFFAFVSAKW
ncbi:MAG: fucose isomerase [Candidatus Thorarchaeota archaeon]